MDAEHDSNIIFVYFLDLCKFFLFVFSTSLCFSSFPTVFPFVGYLTTRIKVPASLEYLILLLFCFELIFIECVLPWFNYSWNISFLVTGFPFFGSRFFTIRICWKPHVLAICVSSYLVFLFSCSLGILRTTTLRYVHLPFIGCLDFLFRMLRFSFSYSEVATSCSSDYLCFSILYSWR